MYFEALIQDISPIEAMEYTKYMKPTPNKNHVPAAPSPLLPFFLFSCILGEQYPPRPAAAAQLQTEI